MSESEKIASCTKSGENSCVVFYGEPTVNLQGKGSGGRNQELVLRLIALYKQKNMRCIVASIGTDGIDGNTKYAGAIYDTAHSCSITEIARFLKENDSSSFFAKHGGHAFSQVLLVRILQMWDLSLCAKSINFIFCRVCAFIFDI